MKPPRISLPGRPGTSWQELILREESWGHREVSDSGPEDTRHLGIRIHTKAALELTLGVKTSPRDRVRPQRPGRWCWQLHGGRPGHLMAAGTTLANGRTWTWINLSQKGGFIGSHIWEGQSGAGIREPGSIFVLYNQKHLSSDNNYEAGAMWINPIKHMGKWGKSLGHLPEVTS